MKTDLIQGRHLKHNLENDNCSDSNFYYFIFNNNKITIIIKLS